MRLLAGILGLAVLSRTASADVEDGREAPVPWGAVGLAFTGQGGSLGGVPLGSMGPTAEIAFGANRTQYVLEGGVAWARLGTLDLEERGMQLRGAAGVRWIARSFELERRAAVELTLDAFGGVRKYWWRGGGELVQPEFDVGFGIQTRHLRSPHAVLRVSMRVVLSPDDDAMTSARCTGDCDPRSGLSNAGFLVHVGVGI